MQHSKTSQNSACALSWVTHPLVEEPWPKSTILIVLILACTTAVAVSFEGTIYAIIAGVVLSASVSRFLLPTRYEVNNVGIVIKHAIWHRTRTWDQVQRIDVHKDGLFLSPFASPSRLDSYRGFFLPGQKIGVEELAECVRQHVQT